jgi:cytochrome c-type biogenesis protein CcmH
MVTLIFTGLAGVMFGIALMRVLRRAAASPVASPAPEATASEGSEETQPSESKTLSARIAGTSLTQKILAGAGVVTLMTVGVVLTRQGAGTSEISSNMSASTASAAPDAAAKLDDVDTMIAKLEARLKDNPDDGEGFRMLGWSLTNTGKPDLALSAYRRALKLIPERADVQAGYGEALVLAAKDMVTPEAKSAFDRAIVIDPKEPRARFFQSLYKAQNGQERVALDEWIALANNQPADLPWQADVRQRIDALAAKLKVDISGRLQNANVASAIAAPLAGASANAGGPNAALMQAASALPPAQREAMISDMVEGLAKKLKANPSDIEGWGKLLRSRMVMGDAAKAAVDLKSAKAALASNPGGLAQINAIAKELSIPQS